jgi:thiol-disulfide isomerase/thioredoxin
MHFATRSPSLHACLIALLVLPALAGCSRQPSGPAATARTEAPAAAPATSSPAGDAAAASHLPPGIDWFQGDVDAAFAAAKSANKPLFLFWGAEWCPPCAQIKSTIFSTREFQERSRLFVPVYLDGDTPSAQRQGERFGIVGYPTMILFGADGRELMRLPGGVDIERYATILDTALASSRPMLETLRAATNGVAMEPADWKLLAWYSWATDNGRLVPAADRVDIFGRMYRYCPESLVPERGRIFFEYLRALSADAKAQGKTGTQLVDAESRKLHVRSLMRLLGSGEAIRANVENLLYAPTDAVGVLSDPGSADREQLVYAWRAALDSLERGGEGFALSGPEQINVYRSRVQLAKLASPAAPLPAELLDGARATATRVLAAAPEGYARHATANAAANLYFEAGLDAEANGLLLAEIEKSKSPYYFMLELASLAKKAGREQEALGWLERAYAGARGPATRFQWGYNYLVGLLEMTPGDTARIERVALEVLGELDESPDAFYQRTRQRLEQLGTKLLDWGKVGKDRAAVVARLRERTAGICRTLPAEDEGRASCEAFLRPAAPATVGV